MKNNLIIASPNEERILLWKQGLNGFVKSSLMTDQLQVLWEDVERTEPEVVLLDLDLLGLKGLNDLGKLSKLCTRTRVVVVSRTITQDLEWELLKTGVRGFCLHEISADLLKKVLMSVQKGELWVRRAVTSRILDEIGNISSKNKVYQASNDLLNKLTEREYDIALHVASGERNKKIAQLCSITERTVKAHLSEVFQKLGIAGRVDLALIMSANNHQQAERQM
jgi:two-component system nitrate/nitrite response regulator NarL